VVVSTLDFALRTTKGSFSQSVVLTLSAGKGGVLRTATSRSGQRLLERRSTEFIQEEETADEDDERNPEMDVGSDRAKPIQRRREFGWG